MLKTQEAEALESSIPGSNILDPSSMDLGSKILDSKPGNPDPGILESWIQDPELMLAAILNVEYYNLGSSVLNVWSEILNPGFRDSTILES